MKKMTYQQIRNVQDTIPCNGYRASYVLGAYEVMLAQLVAELPAAKQADVIRSLESLKARAEKIEG